MKKLVVTMLTILTCGAAFALPVGNPSDASMLCDGLIMEGHCGDPCDPCLSWCDAVSVRVGFWGDYVFNRHLELRHSEAHSNIEHTELFTNAGFISANLWDRLDIFATLGETNLFIDTNASAFAPGVAALNGARIEIETNSHFSWSVGAKATLWECGCTTLGIEGQYFRTHPDIRRVTTASTVSVYPSKVDAKYQEWQVGVGIAHRINIFVPYVAVKLSKATVDFDHAIFAAPTVELFDLKTKKNWGYAVGVSLVDCEKASLTVEGRFGDEKALHVNGQIRF